MKRSKHRLKSFLLRAGYRYQGKACWSPAHMRYLRELVLAHPTQKIILEDSRIPRNLPGAVPIHAAHRIEHPFGRLF
ncbi:MAG TPA: hypothetical protein VIT91_10770 [Chthoniobacterales bacterium]